MDPLNQTGTTGRLSSLLIKQGMGFHVPSFYFIDKDLQNSNLTLYKTSGKGYLEVVFCSNGSDVVWTWFSALVM